MSARGILNIDWGLPTLETASRSSCDGYFFVEPAGSRIFDLRSAYRAANLGLH